MAKGKDGGVRVRDIEERTFEFALGTIYLSDELPKPWAGEVIAKQILRSGTSIGANVEEAHAGYTRNDFMCLMIIAMKEAHETHYWLKLIQRAGLINSENLKSLTAEADEIRKILGAIVSKARGKRR